MIFARGAKQFVVHEALDKMLISGVYLSLFTPMTNMGASAEGAEMMTFFAPPLRCALALSIVVKIPVDSHTISAPASPHGTSSAFLTAKNLMALPSIVRVLFAGSASTVPL